MSRLAALTALVFATACHEGGSSSTVNAGADAWADAPSEDATEGDADDSDGAGAIEDAAPCWYSGIPAAPSSDCVFVGPCPLDCFAGTASEYACTLPIDAGAGGVYPAVFELPIGYIEVVATEDAGYPWDLPVSLSCAPLGCVRWASGDHGEGGSAYPGDPCADAGAATEAWACPPYPGFTPPAPGCSSSGVLGAIGGADSGIPTNGVWCCSPPDED
jgi:hypothetical protein